MAEEQQALEALERVDQELSVGERAIDICSTFRTIQPWLEKALPLIKAIPVHGAKIGKAIEFLLEVGDTFCTQTDTEPAGGAA